MTGEGSGADEAGPQQLTLLRSTTRARRPKPPDGPAATLPVARVAVDVQPPHLDRPFDYTVPAGMADAAVPGVRVRVRFAGRDVDGFLLDRVDRSDHPGALAALRRVVSPEPVLTPDVLRLARAVADRYAGTLPDVLRLAVPPRHAAAERGPGPGPQDGPAAAPGSAQDGDPSAAPRTGPWDAYPAGPAFLARLRAGDAPRAVWTALPGPDWADAVADAVTATLAAGRGSLVVLPDRRDVDLVERALLARLGPGRHARLEADLGPAARYRAFLAVLRGHARVAVGTRAAAFAPVRDLGLVVLWDDGDELHAEPRAPSPHAREVLALRADQSGAAALLGGWARTAEGQALVEGGWAREIDADRATRRHRWARVALAADGPADRDPAARGARMPTTAWHAVRDGLDRGPVLVQVPRTGYVPGTLCGTCRRPARCPFCAGPVLLPSQRSLPAGAPDRPTSERPASERPASERPASGPPVRTPECGWCGRVLAAWTCPSCGSRRLRASAVGVERTAEELGRAFPGATVVVSRAERALPLVPESRALVLATPGVEPFAPGGYAAAVLLDGDALLARPDLRAGEEALRRWRAAAALVRPAVDGGTVVLSADPAATAVQALVRGDPAGFAERELAERRELGLPPGATVAAVTGSAQAVAGLLAVLELPPGTSVLGPVPVPPTPAVVKESAAARGRGVAGDGAAGAGDPGEDPLVRTLLRIHPRERDRLAAALRAGLAVRSARREPGPLRVRIDPRDLG